MPRVQYGAPAQHARNGHPYRELRSAVTDGEPAQKRRRMVSIGSSPPPFSSASHHFAMKPRMHRHDEPEPLRTLSTSPKTSKKRRIVLIRRKNPLDLRSSSPASPDLEQPTIGRTVTAPAPSQAVSVRNTEDAARDKVRKVLQRNLRLDRSDPSSPIGTFAGHSVGRSSRNLCPTHLGSSDQDSRAQNAKTIGLPPLNRSSQSRAGLRGRRVQIPEISDAHNENAEAHQVSGHPLGKTAKRATGETIIRPRRRRAKIHRVDLGGGLPTSSADQPLSDADHQLNSQPDAADQGCFDAADESEISYFPTLRPAQPSLSGVRDDSDATHNAAPLSLQQEPSELSTTFNGASRHSGSKALGQQDVFFGGSEDQSEEADTSIGLLEVLSQSAMRKLTQQETAPAVSFPQGQPRAGSDMFESSAFAEAQHQVQIDFDHSHFTHAQAQQVATSILGHEADAKTWSTVHSDIVPERILSSMRRSSVSQKALQAAFRPPSTRAVCRDLGLSSSQMLRSPCTDVVDFVHHRSDGADAIADCNNDQEDLEPFEHRLRYAGYRQAYVGRSKPQGDTDDLPRLQPFDAFAFHKRRQTRRKEVVKVIVPFSEPPLCAKATRARFLAPHSTVTSLPPPPCSQTGSDGDTILLVWMQSTVYAFFRALESMIDADFSRTAQSSGASHLIDSSEAGLYPCPVLHYAAHANGAKGPSDVALYVHLDRLEEARRTLAEVELGVRGEESRRPFNDPDVRLLVVSLRGEPLCLI